MLSVQLRNTTIVRFLLLQTQLLGVDYLSHASLVDVLHQKMNIFILCSNQFTPTEISLLLFAYNTQKYKLIPYMQRSNGFGLTSINVNVRCICTTI